MTPRPKALIVNFPSNPTTAVRRPALPRAPRRAGPRARLPSHPRPRLRRPRLRRLQAAQRPCRSPAQKTSPSSSSPCPRATTCPAGASASWSATRSSSTPSRGSRATSTTAPSRPSRSPPSLALEGPQDCVAEICDTYRRRRDVLVEGLNKARLARRHRPRPPCSSGRRSPRPTAHLGSLEFSKLLLNEAKVAVVPGIGFGDYGDGHVRFSLIENEERTRQALRGIKQMLAKPVSVG